MPRAGVSGKADATPPATRRQSKRATEEPPAAPNAAGRTAQKRTRPAAAVRQAAQARSHVMLEDDAAGDDDDEEGAAMEDEPSSDGVDDNDDGYDDEEADGDYNAPAVGAAELEARYGKVEHGPRGWGRQKGSVHRTFGEIKRKEAAIAKRAEIPAKKSRAVPSAPAVPARATTAAPAEPAAKKAAAKKAAAKASCAASPSKLSARQLQEETVREVSLLVCASACESHYLVYIGSACPIVSLTPKLCLVGKSARVGSGTSCKRSRTVIAAFAASQCAATRILGCVASRATSTSAAAQSV